MDVRFVECAGVRVELEQVGLGNRLWHRARVVRGHQGKPVGRLPWSYAPRDDQAVTDATQTWTRLSLPDLT